MKISGTAVQKIKGTIAEKTVDSALFTHIMTGIILTIPVFKIFKSIHNYGIIIRVTCHDTGERMGLESPQIL